METFANYQFGHEIDHVIFDSSIDDWNEGTSTFNEKIIGKEKLLFYSTGYSNDYDDIEFERYVFINNEIKDTQSIQYYDEHSICNYYGFDADVHGIYECDYENTKTFELYKPTHHKLSGIFPKLHKSNNGKYKLVCCRYLNNYNYEVEGEVTYVNVMRIIVFQMK